MWHFLISPIFHTMVQKYRNQAEVSLGLEVSVRLLLIPEPKRGALLLLIWYDTVTCERQQTIRNSQRKTGVCLHVEFSATARDASHRTYPSHRSFPDGSATSCRDLGRLGRFAGTSHHLHEFLARRDVPTEIWVAGIG